jgi:hypothetical protein
LDERGQLHRATDPQFCTDIGLRSMLTVFSRLAGVSGETGMHSLLALAVVAATQAEELP